MRLRSVTFKPGVNVDKGEVFRWIFDRRPKPVSISTEKDGRLVSLRLYYLPRLNSGAMFQIDKAGGLYRTPEEPLEFYPGYPGPAERLV